MKALYSIGETAKLLGITNQTLHYYDEVGLVKPAYINRTTGYRYYTSRQFQRIDRIKYLQSLGFSLEEIKASIERLEVLLPMLEQKKKYLEEQRKNITKQIESISWYSNYFRYLDNLDPSHGVHRLHLPQRFGIVVPHSPNELSREADIRLAALRGSKPYRDFLYLRQYGYLLDYQAMKFDKLHAKGYFIFLKERPIQEVANLIEFPEGDYLCFVLQIQKEFPLTPWSHNPYLQIFDQQKEPSLVLANEYEDNLHRFDACKYEIQLLMPDTLPESSTDP